jgi:hypothetical protein
MKSFSFIIILIFTQSVLFCQTSGIEWAKCYGGYSYDRASSILQINDGGYIVAGKSHSNSGDVSGNHAPGSADYWIVKLNPTGIIEWQKCLGGTHHDIANSIQQTSDGGYIVAGISNSNDSDVTGHHGSSTWMDYWIVKLSLNGLIEWQKSLGGTDEDVCNDIRQTSDGGYIIAGSSYSNDGDISGHHGGREYDYWIVKLDSNGVMEWQKSLGGTYGDDASSIQQTNDGGYIIAGATGSNDGDVTGNHGDYDYWIVKLSSSGLIEWQKCLGGTHRDIAKSIQQTIDGGYIIAGSSGSNDGDVTGNHGGDDYWIVKLNSSGLIEWQKSLGGMRMDYAYSIQLTSNGGYIVAGCSNSNDGDVTGHYGSLDYYDYWIVKLNSNGVMEWQKSIGGSDDDEAFAIKQTNDGGYIAAGYCDSHDGIITGNHGSTDFGIIKLSNTINVQEIYQKNDFLLFPNPALDKITICLQDNQDLSVSFLYIYNLQGKILLQQNFKQNNIEINISNLPNGIYFAKLQLNDGIIVQKKFVVLK